MRDVPYYGTRVNFRSVPPTWARRENSWEIVALLGLVWDELFASERVRIAELLIKRVEYDPEGDGVEIEFRREAVAVMGAAT